MSDNTKKIYISSLHMKHGGVEMVIVSLANAFTELNYDVEILCTYNFGTPAYYLDNKVTVTYLTDVLPNRGEIRAAFRSKNLIKIFKECFCAAKVLICKKSTMKRAIKEINEGIFISTRHEHSILLSKYGKPGVLKVAQLHSDHGFNKKLIKEFQSKYSGIDYFTLFTPQTTQEISGFMFRHNLHTKCVTIPNFISPESVDFNEPKIKQVIAAGRLHADKDFFSLLRIWKKVCENRTDYILKIAGEGELETELKAYTQELGINDNVCFTGALPHETLLQEMQKSACYALTSVAESFGLVLVESMYCGTPPIAFDIRVGPRALLKDSINGYLIANRNEDLFAEKLLNLLDDDETLHVMSNNCREIAKNYLKDHVIGLWQDLLDNEVSIGAINEYNNLHRQGRRNDVRQTPTESG